MREALMEMIDLLIMYACERMHRTILVGFSEHIQQRLYSLRGLVALQRQEVMEAFLYAHNGKLMLTNSQLQQRGDVTSEMLPSIDGPVLLQASVSHTAWLTALGSMEFITQTKPNIAPDKHTNTHGHPRTRTSPHTQTQTVTNTVAGPAEAGKVLRCAYESVRGARFLHKPLSTRCATFVTKGVLGHALKLLAAPPLPFIPLTNLQHISTLLACDLKEAAGCLSHLSL